MAEKNAHEFMNRMRHLLRLDKLHPLARKIVVAVAGGTILAIGIIMVVIPGPAFIVIPLGILVLASEFKWAERWAERGRRALQRVQEKWRTRKRRRAAQDKT